MARTKAFNQDDVLNRALEWFWVHGYDGTSVQDLIGHLGISRSSLYGTYGDKHGLFITSMQRYIASSRAFYAEVSADQRPAMDVLTGVLDENWRQQERFKDRRGCFLVNTTTELAMRDKEVARLIKENNTRIQLVLQALIARGQREGSIRRSLDPTGGATAFYNTIVGLQVCVRSGLKADGFQGVKKVALAGLLM